MEMSVQSFIHDQFDRTATLQIISEYQEPGKKSTASIDFLAHLILAIGLYLQENSGRKAFGGILVSLIWSMWTAHIYAIILTLVDRISNSVLGSWKKLSLWVFTKPS